MFHDPSAASAKVHPVATFSTAGTHGLVQVDSNSWAGGGCVGGWGGNGVSCGAGVGCSAGSGRLARPGLRATRFGAPPRFLVGRGCGVFLGVVHGASGCALRPLTPGFSDPHRRTPAPGAPLPKKRWALLSPCGAALRPTLAACAWPLAPA